MKIKPLKNKTRWAKQLINSDYIKFREEDLFLKKDLVSAYLWFKTYMNYPVRLIIDYPEFESEVFLRFDYKQSFEAFKDRIKSFGFDSGLWMLYNSWLIDIAFYDICHRKDGGKIMVNRNDV